MDIAVGLDRRKVSNLLVGGAQLLLLVVGEWESGDIRHTTLEPHVIARIHRLKSLTVDVRAGRATRHFKVVKADGPDDLVFQSLKDGKPMRDGNILRRFIKPAADKLGLRVNWRCLRTSHATWLVQAGADPKSVQGQMRHTRISTTMDIYAPDCAGGTAARSGEAHRVREKLCPKVCPTTGPINGAEK